MMHPLAVVTKWFCTYFRKDKGNTHSIVLKLHYVCHPTWSGKRAVYNVRAMLASLWTVALPVSCSTTSSWPVSEPVHWLYGCRSRCTWTRTSQDYYTRSFDNHHEESWHNTAESVPACVPVTNVWWRGFDGSLWDHYWTRLPNDENIGTRHEEQADGG